MSVQLSVLIDTYNHERYIDAAIRSVLTQEGVDNAAVDVVVIDDGSTDKTGVIVQDFGTSIRYYRKPNGGQASAFNVGIHLCRGEIICFLDGDDWWHRQKLKGILDAFQKEPTTCGVGHSFVEVDEVSGKALTIGPPKPIPISFDSPNSIRVFHQFGCCLGTSRLAMKRSAALALLNIPERLVFEADEYMFTLLPTLGRVFILPDAWTYYRIHGGNLYQQSRAGRLDFSDARLRMRGSIFDCLSKELPIELGRRGCEPSLIDLVLAPLQVQASRLKLATVGGTRLENFWSERRAGALDGNGGIRRRLVFGVSLTLTILLPPKWYFRVREMYAKLLRHLRRKGVLVRLSGAGG